MYYSAVLSNGCFLDITYVYTPHSWISAMDYNSRTINCSICTHTYTACIVGRWLTRWYPRILNHPHPRCLIVCFTAVICYTYHIPQCGIREPATCTGNYTTWVHVLWNLEITDTLRQAILPSLKRVVLFSEVQNVRLLQVAKQSHAWGYLEVYKDIYTYIYDMWIINSFHTTHAYTSRNTKISI